MYRLTRGVSKQTLIALLVRRVCRGGWGERWWGYLIISSKHKSDQMMDSAYCREEVPSVLWETHDRNEEANHPRDRIPKDPASKVRSAERPRPPSFLGGPRHESPNLSCTADRRRTDGGERPLEVGFEDLGVGREVW